MNKKKILILWQYFKDIHLCRLQFDELMGQKAAVQERRSQAIRIGW